MVKTEEVQDVKIDEPEIEKSENPKVFLYQFITKLNNIQFAEDLTLNNLTCVLYECKALSLGEAVQDFISTCKNMFPVKTDEELTSALKVMFGSKMLITKIDPVTLEKHELTL